MEDRQNDPIEKLPVTEGEDVEVDKKTGKIVAAKRYREFGKMMKPIFALVTAVGVLFSVHELFRLGWFSYHEHLYYYGMLAVFLSSSFLMFPISKKARRDRIPWYDYFLALLTVACCLYLMVNAFSISIEGWVMVGPTLSVIVSVVVWGLVLESLRRAGGLSLVIIAGVISIYPLVAEHMPGFLEGTGWSFLGAAKFHVMSRESIIGIPTRTFCELVIGFMIFSSTLQVTGGGVYFTKFASAILGGVRGGPAKVAVAASGLFGMISGSAVANVAAIGYVTIPTMKKAGYEAEFACAVEACASSGGAIMPPVMGAVAFVMASFLGVPYVTVCIAAVVPAFLYYFGLYVQIDGHAAKRGLKGLSKLELPSLKETLKEGWVYLASILALIYLLFALKQEAQAPYIASVLLLFGASLKKRTRPTFKTLYDLILNSGTVLVEMIAILAGIGLIMGGLSMTGVAISFSSELVNLFGKNAFLMLFLGMIVSYILGMGMTITACYIILAVVLVPALTPLGFDVTAVHLFVLYCGLFSFITPPVALAAYIAAVIGGADFWKTGMQSMRLGFVKYLVPFFFVYDPALILHGPDPLVIALKVAKSFVGVWILGSGIEGYLAGVGILAPFKRMACIAGGFLLFYPGWWTDGAGTLILIGMYGVTFLQKRFRKPSEAAVLEKMK
jgi:TRAP transporter 4TM/12TM fusion protein